MPPRQQCMGSKHMTGKLVFEMMPYTLSVKTQQHNSRSHRSWRHLQAACAGHTNSSIYSLLTVLAFSFLPQLLLLPLGAVAACTCKLHAHI